MAVLDATPLTEDLALDLPPPKRKGLKRLRKVLRAQQASQHDDAGETENQAVPAAAFAVREWPGLDASAVVEASLRSLARLAENTDDEAVSAERAAWAAPAAKLGEPVRANVTTAHRVLVRARADGFAAFAGEYAGMLDEVSAYYDALLADEAEWARKWGSLVRSLAGCG